MAELFAFEGTKTGNDTVLSLPQESIVFMSDLLIIGCHPYLADGDPLQLLKALKKIQHLMHLSLCPDTVPLGLVTIFP